jgi:hypothetical protein
MPVMLKRIYYDARICLPDAAISCGTLGYQGILTLNIINYYDEM